MEPMLETIDLDIEEASELLFRVKVEGADQAPVKVKMVCESTDLGFTFNGQLADNDGLIQFNLPVMKDKLKEGIYQARVEVLIENRYFAPVQFQINFKKAIKVVAESVNFVPHRPMKQDVKVTASSIPAVKQVTVAPPVHQEVLIETVVEPITTQTQILSELPKPTSSLRDRYHTKKDESPKELDENAILNAAKAFVNDRRKK